MTFNNLKFVAIIAIVSILFVGNTDAQINTDTIAGLYLKDWHPDVTVAGQWVSDTTFNGLKSRGIYWNSTNSGAWVSFEKSYDTARLVPTNFDIQHLYAPYDLNPAILEVEFINEDTTQSNILGATLNPETEFYRTQSGVDVSSGPVYFKKIRFTLRSVIFGGTRNLCFAGFRAIYGPFDTVLVENFAAPPNFLSSTNNIDFDSVIIGLTKKDTIMVKNNGESKLQISSASVGGVAFSIVPTSATINRGDSLPFVLFFSPAYQDSFGGEVIFTHDAITSPDTVLVKGVGYVPDTAYEFTTGLGTGWQMISLPFAVLTQNSYQPLLLYEYRSSYVSTNSMETGKGYWHKYPGPGQMIFIGYEPPAEVNVLVQSRWNIVGTPSVAVPAVDVTTNPSDLVVSNFFGYNGENYFIADTLKPGMAYWVKVASGGTMTLAAGGGIINPTARVKIELTDELPPPPPDNSTESVSNPFVPAEFQLAQNYPNPFNPTTTIEFSLPRAGFVTLKVYNLLGEELATVTAEELPPGTYKRTWNAFEFASGVYYYRIQSMDFTETKKLVLIK